MSFRHYCTFTFVIRLETPNHKTGVGFGLESNRVVIRLGFEPTAITC